MRQSNLDYQFGFHDKRKPFYKAQKGLSKKIVNQISGIKDEPEWMRKKRLLALDIFEKKKLPAWGPDLEKINFDEFYYYVKPIKKKGFGWDQIPKDIKNTFDVLGVPEAEKKFLSGVGAQYDSEIIYSNISKMLSKKGVI